MVRLLWVLALSACSSRSAPAGDPPATAEPAAPIAVSEPASLSEALAAEADGAPVLLVATEDGLVARTPERVLRTLAPGFIDEAGYDAATELVFVRREGRFEVVDLREPDPQPLALLRELPDEMPLQVLAGGRTIYDEDPRAPAYLVFRWSSQPSLDVELTIEDLASEEMVAEARLTTVAGTDWIAAHHARAPRGPQAPAPRDADRVAGLDEEECYDEEVCGSAQHFGDTGWVLFVAGYGCGDYCYWSCLLSNPDSGQVAVPTRTEPDGWQEPAAMADHGACGPYYFDRERARFAHGELLCAPGAGCAAMGGKVLGFLSPGPTIAVAP